MQIIRCPAPGCRRPFQVNRFRNTLTTSLESGRIICPHCGMLLPPGEADSVFLTHALSVDEETRLNQSMVAAAQVELCEYKKTG